jgi:hypothetical protein
MGTYSTDTLVTVYPFTQERDGSEVTIGNATHSAFLSIPATALDILSSLTDGKTVGETQALYEQQHGEKPDIKAFLKILEREGFVAPSMPGEQELMRSALISAPSPSPADMRSGGSHFKNISPEVARRICSRQVITCCGLVILLGLALIAAEPSLLPPPSILVFQHHLTLLNLATTAFVFGSVFVHELGHLIAARAAGVPARLGISHRLWALVAETDMTGIWRAPKRQRYLAFLAGPLIDATSASALIMLLWAGRHSWLRFPPIVTLLAQVFLLTYLLRLLFQCFLFVRTDFYYVITNLLNCKSLLSDTENFLHNQLTRLIPSRRKIDQSAIPVREMHIIRYYSIVWLVGRVVAFSTLFFISLPILWGYIVEIASVLLSPNSSPYEVIDALTLTLTVVAIECTGMVLWIRSLYKKARKEKSNELAAS